VGRRINCSSRLCLCTVLAMRSLETGQPRANSAGRHARVEKPPRSDLPVLAPFYYLKNFELVLATIESRYSDLLLEEELRFIAQFRRMPMESQALLVRMVMRRGELFRSGKLNYSEIGETRMAAAPLIEAGWVSDRPLLRFEEVHGILTKEELIRCLRLPRRYASWRKGELKAMLQAQFSEPRLFGDWYACGESVYALLIARLSERMRLMFFGNYAQSWTEFVTADLGIFRYEKVERSLHSRPFQSRSHIEVFQQIQDCRELLAQGMPLAELLVLVPGAIGDSEWLEERRQKLLFSLAREYERAGELAKALELYLRFSYRGARTRATRLKCQAKDWEGARALCLLARAHPEGEAELHYVRRALPRINKKLGLACDGVEAPPAIEDFAISLEKAAGGAAVEYLVRDHLGRELADRSTVRYIENSLIPSLFGLLCWAAIFKPVPGAFFHDFHHGPIDLESGDFHRRRGREFDDCLSHLDSGGYRQVIWKCFKEKWGLQSPFVRWHHLDKTLLRWALDCIPAAHLRSWFEWILRDVKENRAGFPDLVQFYPQQRRYRMIEVKGPGDRVQDNQRRLLEYCVAKGMPVSVCYVSYVGRC
jgi:hypothetical protein